MLARCQVCGWISNRDYLHPSEGGLLCDVCSRLTQAETERLRDGVCDESTMDTEAT